MGRYEWDEANEAHIARHGVSRAEAEQALAGNPMEFGAEYRHGEHRASVVGKTEAGRILFVVVTTRGNALRVVTAYPAQPRMRALYEEHGQG